MNTFNRLRDRIPRLVPIVACLAVSAAAWGQEADEPESADTAPPETEPAHLELLVHPDYAPEAAEQRYRPLAEYLNAATDHRIDLVTVRGFQRYWLNARRGQNPDLVLEDAHMAAWRMANQNYTPLARADGTTGFALLAGGEEADQAPESLIGRRIATLPAPSLGYVVLADWYDNPMRQPRIQSDAASWPEAAKNLVAGHADAAMVPRSLVPEFPDLHVVRESREFPGLTLSVAADVEEGVREDLLAALEALHEDPEHASALSEMNIQRFAPADPDDYIGLEALLDAIFSM